MKKIFAGIISGILALVLLTSVVLAYAYSVNIAITNNSTTAYPMLPMIASNNNTYLVDYHYMNASGNDTRVTISGLQVPHLIANNKTLFATAMPALYSSSALYTFGETELSNFPVITGYGGYVTTADNNSLEMSNNATWTISGYINTDAGANKNLIYKQDAINVFVSPTVSQNITATIVASAISTTSTTVATATDDVMKYWNGATFVLTTGGNLIGGYYNAANARCGTGLRFNNVAIPRGAVITTANVTLTGSDIRSLVTVRTRLTGEDVDNAANFTTLANFNARVHTTANISWDAIGAWGVGVAYPSPEINTIIQEIVNRPGWVSGNSIVIFWEDWENRSTNIDQTCRIAYSFESDSVNCAKLKTKYYLPSATVTAMGVASGNHTITIAIEER